tara:strand:+ start:22655 stop:23860 length:1206 start_codon:yes stop_codon:yes gene_type:complete
MSTETNENSLEGFKNLAADIMPAENIEVKEVTEVPSDDLDKLGSDTGIVDLTPGNKLEDESDAPESMDDKKEEEKEESPKEELSADNLEIQYKKEIPEGEVTEEELEAEESSEDEVSQIGVVANFLKEEGIVDFDSEEFEDTEEGFAKVIQNEITKGVEKYKEDLEPLAKEFLTYIEKGGDPSKFVKATSDVDFSKIDVKMIDGKENLQKQLVAELMRKEGYSNEEIMEDVKDFTDGGLIAKKAKRALAKLKDLQVKDRATLLADQEKAEETKKEEYQTFLSSLKDDIESRDEIAGFAINKKSKKDFYNYITKVDRKTGKTRLVSDSEADKDSQLKMAWLYYNKFDFKQVEKKARTKATSSLRASLERASGVSTRKLKSKTRTKATNSDIDFSLFANALNK